MALVKPGFLVGLVFWYLADLRTLHTVEAEISMPLSRNS